VTAAELNPLNPYPLPLDEIKATLADTPLFFGIDVDCLEGQLARIQGLTLHDGEVLLSPQRPNRRIYIIAEGKLRVHLRDCEHPPLVVMRRGECAGELSIIDRDNPSAYVVSEGTSRVLVVDEEVLWALVDDSHALARNLLYTLSQRMRFGHSVILDGVEAQRRWERLATIDALTDLHNRRWLNTAFDRQLARCRTAGQPLSVVMLDIDHFKRYNDEHGHPAGDRALTVVARAMRDHLRPNDLAVRYGGEEFVVLLPNTDLRGAFRIAERLRTSIAETPVLTQENQSLPAVNISLGVATADPESQEGSDDLLARADVALYRAKDRGRNRVEKG